MFPWSKYNLVVTDGMGGIGGILSEELNHRHLLPSGSRNPGTRLGDDPVLYFVLRWRPMRVLIIDISGYIGQ